ncbi:hypothetical protein [Streptomyces lavendofoliae]|uniref:hypothetical protein n=1 Tax=Streptomyces lavendofoliae TaxID=67314 RepID=UPI003D944F48
MIDPAEIERYRLTEAEIQRIFRERIVPDHRRENVLRFGDYTSDKLHIPAPAYNPVLSAAAAHL